MKFSDGYLLKEVILGNGAKLWIGQDPEISYSIKEMVISMQPSHGGEAPWIHVIFNKEDDEYINMATVQKVILK